MLGALSCILMLSFCGHFRKRSFVMSTLLSSPVTAAQQQDLLRGALLGLARSTVNEPKTEDTDRVLAAGLRLAAKPEADTTARWSGCATSWRPRNTGSPQLRQLPCAAATRTTTTLPGCGMRRPRSAPLKLELLAALFALAQRRSTERIADEIERLICPRRGLGYNPCCPHRSARPRAMPRVTFWGNSR